LIIGGLAGWGGKRLGANGYDRNFFSEE